MKFVLAVILLMAYLLPPPAANGGELRSYTGNATQPSFILEDLAGHAHSLSDYRGQVVLVNFWATWCPPCLAEMPSMQRLANALQKQPFSILAINVEQSKSTVWKFRELLGIDFTTLLDITGATARSWDINIYPTSYLIDTQGRVRYTVQGALEWDAPDTTQLIEALLPASEGEPVSSALYSRP
jgi:thiol-disulfide isomerase/thioredoxin